jgi:hypothetical protein
MNKVGNMKFFIAFALLGIVFLGRHREGKDSEATLLFKGTG